MLDSGSLLNTAIINQMARKLASICNTDIPSIIGDAKSMLSIPAAYPSTDAGSCMSTPASTIINTLPPPTTTIIVTNQIGIKINALSHPFFTVGSDIIIFLSLITV